MKKPRIAVFKFASCDGCQLQFLNMENELLRLAELVDFAYFPEARSRAVSGPYDIAFVEGSISTGDDADRIVRVRDQSRYLVTIGACATAGGIRRYAIGRTSTSTEASSTPPPVHCRAPELHADRGARSRGLRDLGVPGR